MIIDPKWKIEQIHRWASYAKKVKSISNRNLETTSYKFVNSHNIDGLIIGATKKAHMGQLVKNLILNVYQNQN